MNPRPDITVHPARILIVDDEADNRALLELVLNREGYLTLTAASGEEALETVAQQPIDLVLLDLMMPGMDGYEVTVQLKENFATKDIPVMLVTAMNDSATRKRAVGAGAEDVLSKPINRFVLCERVKKLLCLKTARGQ